MCKFGVILVEVTFCDLRVFRPLKSLQPSNQLLLIFASTHLHALPEMASSVFVVRENW